MNTHDVPMILFTVVTQMCVGAFFLVLGTAHVGAAIRGRENSVVERTSRPVLYAIGPAMVFGLFVSMFHMGYPAHTLNVLRHPQTSWLSREIMFGSGFALLGFVFAMLSWFKRPAFAIQRVLAVVTAIVGIGLLVCESMIYYSLVTVPAWHSWWVPFSFAATTIILGTLSVACALMITAMVRHRHETAVPSAREKHPKTTGWWSRHVTEEIRAINAPTDDQEWDLSLTVTKWCSIGAAVVSVASWWVIRSTHPSWPPAGLSPTRPVTRSPEVSTLPDSFCLVPSRSCSEVSSTAELYTHRASTLIALAGYLSPC